eukprot:scaffold40369_cov51-Phaeocystis_antarctica.AAC.3
MPHLDLASQDQLASLQQARRACLDQAPAATTSSLARRPPCGETTPQNSLTHTHRPTRHSLSQVQVEIKKGQTIMVDANLQQPGFALFKSPRFSAPPPSPHLGRNGLFFKVQGPKHPAPQSTRSHTPLGIIGQRP